MKAEVDPKTGLVTCPSCFKKIVPVVNTRLGRTECLYCHQPLELQDPPPSPGGRAVGPVKGQSDFD